MSDLTVAASEKSFQELFNAIRDNFKWQSKPQTHQFGAYSLSYDIDISLENGSVDLQSNNTVKISELDIKWNKFILTVGVDIPSICVGGWCVNLKFTSFCVPPICVFGGNPDISVPLDLSGLLTSELSGAASLKTVYKVNHPPSMSYLDAKDSGVANKWQVFIVPKWADVDLFDFADSLDDLLDKIVDAAIDKLPGPGWAKNLALGQLGGSMKSKIIELLDFPDDFGEWIANKLNQSIGLGNTIIQLVAAYFASRNPILEFEDPYPLLPAENGLIPVMVPIKGLDVNVTDDEMIVSANIGA